MCARRRPDVDSRSTVTRRQVLIGGIAAATTGTLAACTSARPSNSPGSAASSSQTSAAQPATMTFTPPRGSTGVDPLGRVSVSVANGTLASVAMTNTEGKTVIGVLTPDRMSWKPTEPLGFGKTYSLTATSRDTTGRQTTDTTSFTTVEPRTQTMVSLTTTGGTPITAGGTYGIGIVVVAHFDEPISDRTAAQRRLSVRTTPPVPGQWMWVDDQNAHWRPERYYTPGTRVEIAASVYGVALGDGLYGQEDTATTFQIGPAHVAIADDNTKQVTVYDNGKLVRTMPTSMGMGGTETINGQTLSFWTQRGIYTVLDKSNPVIMDSSTYGLPINSRLGYRETIYYATRISNDGIYLHQLESSIWAQGNTNTSHGCLNLNPANAQWFYDFSQPGDIVEVRNTGGDPLTQAQNGDWSVPWTTWQQGSAL
ncbi:L,D-transpeptidase [Williamsia herbipolensis]|uniref:L,D-transpeptidase n=1 Tax=Williamsia herbipolensis TaxID=1603258 RepID=UPI0009E245DF